MAGSNINIQFDGIDNVTGIISNIANSIKGLSSVMAGLSKALDISPHFGDDVASEASSGTKAIQDLANSTAGLSKALDVSPHFGDDVASEASRGTKAIQDLANSIAGLSKALDVSPHFGDDIQAEASKGSKAVQDLSGSFAGLKSNMSDAGTLLGAGLSMTLGKSLMDATISSNSLRETTKLLVSDLGDASMSGEKLFSNMDKYTNNALVGLDGVITATNTFKGSTGASATQADRFAEAASKMGTRIIAMGRSTDEADQAMLSLTRGIGGAFAALDQYGITQASLMNTGLWSGEKDDIDGFIAALDAATGDTSKFMDTFAGQSAIAQKKFGIFMRDGSAGIFNFAKDILKGFNQADKGTQDFVFSILGAGSAIATFASAAAPVVTTIQGVVGGVRSLAGAFKTVTDSGGLISNMLNKIKGTNLPDMKGKGSELDTATKETEDISKRIDKLNNLKINVKNNIVNVLKGAAIALVAIGAALVVFLAALAAIAVFGVAYKALQKQVNDGVQGLMAVVLPMTLLVAAGLALSVVGAAIGLIPAMIVGVAVALIAIGLALVTFLGAAWELATFGDAVKPLIPGVQQAGKALSDMVPVLQTLAEALLLIAAVELGVAITAFGTFMLGLADFFSGLITGKSVMSNVFTYIAGVIRDIKQGLDSNQDLFNSDTAGKLNNLAESLKPLKNALDALKSSMGDLKTTLQTYQDLKWEQFWQGMTVGSAINGVMSLLEEVSTTISSRTIDTTVSEKLSTLNDALSPLSNVLGTLKNTITNIKTVIDSYGELSTAGGGSGWGAVKNVGKSTTDNGGVAAVIDNVMSLVQSISTTIANYNTEEFTKLGPQLEALNTTLSPLSTALSTLKTTMDSIIAVIEQQTKLGEKAGGKAIGQGKEGSGEQGWIELSLNAVRDAASTIKTIWEGNTATFTTIGPILEQLNGVLGPLGSSLQQLKTFTDAIITVISAQTDLGAAAGGKSIGNGEKEGEQGWVQLSLGAVSDTCTAIVTWWNLHSGDVTAVGPILDQLLPIVTSMASNLGQLRSAIDSLVAIVSGMSYLAGKDIQSTIKNALTKVRQASDQLKDHGLTDPGNGAETAVGTIKTRLEGFQTAINNLPTIDYSSIQSKITAVDEAKKKLGELSTALQQYADKNATLPAGQRGPNLGIGRDNAAFGAFSSIIKTYSTDITHKVAVNMGFDNITATSSDDISSILAGRLSAYINDNQQGITKEWFQTREFKQILSRVISFDAR